MASATELHCLSARLHIWHVYEPKVKANLFSTAITLPSGLFLVDPIPIKETGLQQLSEIAPAAGIIITNSNHERAAEQFAEHFSIPVFSHPQSLSQRKAFRFHELTDENQIDNELTVLVINGAPMGEIALYHRGNDGTLIIGDALINFEPLGFTFLPPRYCVDEREMKRSLRRLLDRAVERILFAHGFPILSNGNAHLRHLLDENPGHPQ